jgi:hypothetical protein
MDFFKTVESWCAVGFVTFFFIPWIKVLGLFSLTGVQAASFASSVLQSPYISIFFYIIPILGFLILFQGSRNQLAKWLLFTSGLYPLLFFLIVYLLHGLHFHYLSGVYLTIIASVCLVILSFTSKHTKK